MVLFLSQQLLNDPVPPVLRELIQFSIRPVLDWVRHENHCGVEAKRRPLSRSGVNEFRSGDANGWNASGL